MPRPHKKKTISQSRNKSQLAIMKQRQAGAGFFKILLNMLPLVGDVASLFRKK